MKFILTAMFLFSGIGLCGVISELFGLYSLIITIPLAFEIGWEGANLLQVENGYRKI